MVEAPARVETLARAGRGIMGLLFRHLPKAAGRLAQEMRMWRLHWGTWAW